MFQASRYQSASCLRLSGSVTTTQRQPCWLPPVGACSASSRHSSITSAGTGLSRSRRLRTARVVVSSSSTVLRSIGLPQSLAYLANECVPVDPPRVRRVHLDHGADRKGSVVHQRRGRTLDGVRGAVGIVAG